MDASVVKNGKGKKVVIFKYKPKKGYRQRQGHRQPYTKVEIRQDQRLMMTTRHFSTDGSRIIAFTVAGPQRPGPVEGRTSSAPQSPAPCA